MAGFSFIVVLMSAHFFMGVLICFSSGALHAFSFGMLNIFGSRVAE